MDPARLLQELVAAFDEAGAPIEAPVRVVVRAGLPAEGTTVRDGDGYLVLLSDRALASGRVAPLLAHELGHVQRLASGHPSHDDEAITAAYAGVAGQVRHAFQRSVLHHVINYTQDLYADPLSLRIARRLRLVTEEELERLIAGFANDEPYRIADPLERRWDQAEDMVGNARAAALAGLAGAAAARGHVEDVQRRYLARIAPDIAREAPWFQARLDDLPEDVTREGFRALLAEYVQRFVATANGVSRPSPGSS